MQNYKNHVKWYPAHHFIYAPIMIALIVFSVWNLIHALKTHENIPLSIALLWIVLMVFWLAGMLRAHYSLVLQNRIIVNEVEFRYYKLTGKTFEEAGLKLTDPQIYGLRFAPDEEFLDLANRAVKENLTGDQIKRAIKNWKADNRRV